MKCPARLPFSHSDGDSDGESHGDSDGSSHGGSHGNPSAQPVMLDSQISAFISRLGAFKDEVPTEALLRYENLPAKEVTMIYDLQYKGNSYALSTAAKTSTAEVVGNPA